MTTFTQTNTITASTAVTRTNKMHATLLAFSVPTTQTFNKNAFLHTRLVTESTTVRYGPTKVLSTKLIAQTTTIALANLQRIFTRLKMTSVISMAQQTILKLTSEIQALILSGATPVNLPPTDSSNPLKPTIYVDGSAVATHSATTQGAGSNYIALDESQIAPGCDLITLNMALTFGGGSFNLETHTDSFVLGQVITIFGIKCVIVRRKVNTGGKDSFTYSGLIGDSRGLNKKILLTLDTSALQGLGNLFPNAPFQSPSSVQWLTISAAAQALAAYAGISLTWATKDAPLLDTFIETNMTIGEAINSLVSRVKGILVFDGQNNWIATDPVAGYGGWGGVPHCGLYANQNALNVEQIMDIVDTMVTVPIKPLVTSTITNMPTNPPPPIIEPISFQKNVMQPDDAPVLVALPGDANGNVTGNTFFPPLVGGQFYDPNNPQAADFNSFVQILLPTAQPQITNSFYIPSTELDPTIDPAVLGLPYTTLDPKQWFPYVFPMFFDTVQQKMMLVVTPDFFPNNQPDPPAKLTNGKFTFSIGYQRRVKPLVDAYTVNIDEAIQRAKLYQQYQLGRINYFEYQTAETNFAFFGSVGLPGNKVSLSNKSASITGIIKTFNISFTPGSPPMASATVGTSVSLNLINPSSQLDYFLATGTTPP